ncbi:MAG: hypothetical protein AAAFM81_09845, partial [Pseudomonadota bacterium]
MFTRLSTASIAAAITTASLLTLMTALIAGKVTVDSDRENIKLQLGSVELDPPQPDTPEAPPEPPPPPADTPTHYRDIPKAEN